MQFRTETGSNQFQIGEVIRIEALLSSSTLDRYLEPCQLFSQGTFGYPQCRFFSQWTFTISPEGGWWDHAKDPPGLRTSGGPMFEVPSRDLTSQPIKYSYTLSDRFRFDKPGQYRVHLSVDVGVDDETTQRKAPQNPKVQRHAVTVTRELVLEIVPATAEWEREIIRKGYQAFSGPIPADRNPPSPEQLEYEQATKALCNLGTPEAARTFARLLSQGHELGGCLFRSPSVAAGVEEMQRLLVDPDAAIPPSFFTLLVALLNGDESRKSGVLMISQRIVDTQREILLRALPQKHGSAQISCLVTILQNPPRSKGTPFEFAYPLSLPPEVIAVAIANFDQIAPEFQERLVGDLWDNVRSPLMLPVVRRNAESGNGPALLRWLELDPAAATAFIRTEVVRPAPRFSSFYLRLPDRSLPNEQSQIAANFVALRDERALTRSATLLHRYATDAVLPDVLPFIDANLSRWSCWVQFPVLAYLLKVSPANATSRVKLALEQANNGRCMQWAFLSYLGAVQPSPVLEQLALEQIDTGTKFAADAADYLQRFGSAAMKHALWDQLERWHKGVPPGARKQPGDQPSNDKSVQDRMVGALGRALVEGHAWVLSPEEVDRLENLVGKNAIGQLACEFSCGGSTAVGSVPGAYSIYGWTNNRASQIPNPDYLYSVERLYYKVNQYVCPDLKSLKEKLLQFPAGSSFDFAWDLSGRDRDELVVISDFLWSHGYKVRNPQNWPFLRKDAPQ